MLDVHPESPFGHRSAGAMTPSPSGSSGALAAMKATVEPVPETRCDPKWPLGAAYPAIMTRSEAPTSIPCP